MAINVGEAVVAAAVPVGQPFVIEAHDVQDPRVQVVVVDLILHGVPAEFIGGPVDVAGSDDLLTGVGSMTVGARWNAPKSFPALYVSLDPHPALDEVLAHFRYYQIPIESAMPRVTVSFNVHLDRSSTRSMVFFSRGE